MLPLFFSSMFVLLVAFWLASQLIRIEYQFHRENWDDDGKPADYFWFVSGSYVARFAVSLSWIFATPDWMKSEPRASKIVVWYRALMFLWIVGWIAMVVLYSRAKPVM
jgi:hypothetical protein